MNTTTQEDPLTPDEQTDALQRLADIRHRRATDPAYAETMKHLEQALTLVNDLKADGATLTHEQFARLTTMLYSQKDHMIEAFTAIKAAGRRQALNTTPPVGTPADTDQE